MSKEEYEKLRGERDHITQLIARGVPPHYKEYWDNRLADIRVKIKEAHKYDNSRTKHADRI